MTPSTAFGIALLASALPVLVSSAPHAYWLEAHPTETGEAEVRDVVARAGFAGPQATAQALAQISAARPGTAASGLAQLAAGLVLLDGGRPAEALPFLRHPDVALTALTDHAVRAVGHALEAERDLPAAAAAFLAAVDARPEGPLACTALLQAAEILQKSGPPDTALAVLDRAFGRCAGQASRVLLLAGMVHEARRDPGAAAAAYDRIDADHPTSAEAREAGRRLHALARHRPPLAPEARVAREIGKAQAFFGAGRYSEAAGAFRTVRSLKPQGADADLVHVRLGRALLATKRLREARAELEAVPADSPHAAEAAYALARIEAGRSRRPDAYESVATRFAGTPWAEEALAALAVHFQKDARDDEALPYYRRLVEAYPEGRHAERATWRVAWADYRAGRFEEAAQRLERSARLTRGTSTSGFLYWAGRARRERGEYERARQLLREVEQRFKYTYYGARAVEVLAGLPAGGATPPPALKAPADAPGPEVPEPHRTRARQLLLLDRLDEAREELQTAAPSPTTHATIAWIESRRGRLRPAILAMKRAYPEYAGEAGGRLPEEVWRILYPLDFAGLLLQKAAEEGLDPALVAALVCQESTFNPGAVSPAGARGLMQVIPKTGRALARSLGLRYRTQILYDPAVSLDMGTRYLRQMLDRFGGRVEQALAAYNAGPHRVDAWTAGRPDATAEEFIESIPFTETRNYVKVILGSREQYRRLYSFPDAVAPAPAAVSSSLP